MVRCATDVTGYGLLGHLREVVDASDVSARIDAGSVPVLDGIAALVEDGVYPSGSVRNLESVAGVIETTLGATTVKILADAQTSGGLLMAVKPGAVDDLLAELATDAPSVAVVGEIVSADEARRIVIT